MSLNKKGFVLIETLAVTVFAATIFVFLFKSVVPIMGIYDTKIDQIGNIDAVYNNYHVRKMIYNDDCYNNRCKDEDGHYINSDAIKNLDYALIRCDNYYYEHRIKDIEHGINETIDSTDRKHFVSLNSSDYCKKVMEAIGARTKAQGTEQAKDHYWIFYIKGDHFDKFFSDNALGMYNKYLVSKSYNERNEMVQGVEFSQDTIDLLSKTLKEYRSSKEFKEHDSYLVLYYWYINPMYSEVTAYSSDNQDGEIIPKYKDAVSILTVKDNSENLYCFKFQVIPKADKYYYAYSSSSSGYYFFYDEKYTTTKLFTGDAIDKCEKAMNGKRVKKLDSSCNVMKDENGRDLDEVLGSTTVNKYCSCQRAANPTSFYNTYSGDSLTDCTNYMKNRNVSINASNAAISNQGFEQIGGSNYDVGETTLNEADAKAYCEDLLRNHNQAYKIYTIDNNTKNNCKHYFKSYNSIRVRPTTIENKGNYKTLTKGDFTTLTFSNTSAIDTLCNNVFSHYYLGTIWDDFTDATIGIPKYDNGEAELAIVDYDANCSKDVVIPASAYNDWNITMIGSHAFERKGIRTVKFNGKIKIIDKDAFLGNVYTLNPPSGALVVKN